MIKTRSDTHLERFQRKALVMVFSSISFSSPVLAANSGDELLLEEVVVTAQKRIESLQDVPIAVSAVGGDKIRELNISTMSELSLLVPSLHIGQAASGDMIVIRGVGSGRNQGFEQSVGLFFDGVYGGRGRLTRTALFDVAQVEVLKGPQGVLFGKNTIGGAISVRSESPTDEVSGYVRAGYDFEQSGRTVDGVISGGLSESVKGRLSVRYADGEGDVTNVAINHDEPELEDSHIIRGTLQWEPTSDLTVTARVQSSEYTVLGSLIQPTCDQSSPTALVDDCRLNSTSKKNFSGMFSDIETDEYEDIFSSLTIDYSMGDHTLTAITGFVDYENYVALDADGIDSSAKTVHSERAEDFDSWSQEIRLLSPSDHDAALDYIAGIYYESNDLTTSRDVHFTHPALGTANDSSVSMQEGETLAVFGQVTWRFADDWSVSAGARYTEEEKDIVKDQTLSDIYTRNPKDPDQVYAGRDTHYIEARRDEDDLSPSLTLTWDANDSAMLYASYKEGFKAGGFDHQLGNISKIDSFEYDAETVESLEVGGKLVLLDGRADMNVAVFRNSFEDMQVSSYDGVSSFNVGNAAESVSQGIEFDSRIAVTDGLVIGGALTYLDAYFEEYAGPCYKGQTPEQGCVNSSQDLADETMPFAPEWTANLYVSYRTLLSDSIELSSLVDFNYVDDQFFDTDLDENMVQEAYTKINARIALTGIGSGWEVALVGRNLTDKTTATFSTDLPFGFDGDTITNKDTPRVVEIQFGWNF